MSSSELITKLSEIILSWEDTSHGRADFGAVAFLSNGREMGHIHPGGELDIAFGRQVTEALLGSGLVEMHQFVPKTSVTFRVKKPENIDFAVGLLRLSRLLQIKPRTQKYAEFLADHELCLSEIPQEILVPLRNL